MSKTDEQAAPGWRHKLPLVLGIGLGGLLFVYLVLPGFVLGLLFRFRLTDPITDSPARRVVDVVFCIPKYLADNARPIRKFYQWQTFVAGGIR